MKKMYVNEEDLNEEEKRTGCVSYARLCNKLIGNNMVLCNSLPEVDPTIWENFTDEDNDEIYQYYIIGIDDYGIERNEELGKPLIITYSELLSVYVLLVDHYGTGWDYVMTDVKWTTDINEAM